MTATRRLLALSAAVGSCGLAASALAQDMPTGPDAPYEYAVPTEGGIVFEGNPVIQTVPAPPPPSTAWHDHGGNGYEVETYRSGPLPPPYVGGPMPVPMAHPGHMVQRSYAPPVHPGFDRAAWLDDCRLRTRSIRNRDERASVIGWLLGAVAGGVVGNRVYDSERLAGTLIGAGVGGLAGLAIGAAIDAAGMRRRGDECAMYLDHYMSGGFRSAYPAYGYGNGYNYGYGYNFGYGYGGFAYMPVLVAVPQRQVVREYVTEEAIDVPVRTRTVTETRVIRERAPAPAPVRHDKRLKLIKQ